MDTLLQAVLEEGSPSPPLLAEKWGPQQVAPHELYKLGRYDWTAFRPDYVVIPLTKGYFTMVEREDVKRALLLRSLRAREEICPETGRVLKVRAVGQIGEKKYYLHRFLMHAGRHDVIDHFNRHPLCNCRGRNLVNTNQGTNLSNTERRGKNRLLRGVEQRGNKYGGKIVFEGENFRSTDCWTTQEPAHAWYLEKHKELYGYTKSNGAPLARWYPVFPPEKGVKNDLPF